MLYKIMAEINISQWKDCDGDTNISIEVDSLTVFATEQISGNWTLNFALTSEVHSDEWMDTLTGVGAFRTMRAIRPAVEALVAKIATIGGDWMVCCDRRRARLYSRYIPVNRIQVVE